MTSKHATFTINKPKSPSPIDKSLHYQWNNKYLQIMKIHGAIQLFLCFLETKIVNNNRKFVYYINLSLCKRFIVELIKIQQFICFKNMS